MRAQPGLNFLDVPPSCDGKKSGPAKLAPISQMARKTPHGHKPQKPRRSRPDVPDTIWSSQGRQSMRIGTHTHARDWFHPTGGKSQELKMNPHTYTNTREVEIVPV